VSDFKYYKVVPSFLDEQTVGVLAKYIQNRINMSSWDIRDNPNNYNTEPSAFNCYGDPLLEIILKEQTDNISEIVGKTLCPTYSYGRVYAGNDELTNHVDRESCEYSVTITVGVEGNPWPIWMKAPDSKPQSFELSPGDAVVYKGCEVRHWRNPMPQYGCSANAQFMLHYVDMNGPFADFKYDKRPDLGMPRNNS